MEYSAIGVTRRRNVKREFWRVRLHPEGMWLVEVLREYRRRPAWWMYAQYRTQEAATEMFNDLARPLPPGLSPPPSGIKPEPYEHPDRWRAEEEAELRAQQAEALRREEAEAERKQAEVIRLFSGFSPDLQRPN